MNDDYETGIHNKIMIKNIINKSKGIDKSG